MNPSTYNTRSLGTHALALVLTATTFGVLSSPAVGQELAVTVTPPTEMEVWSKTVTRNLDRRLARPEIGNARIGNASGIVQLRFTLDEKGHPENILLFRSSGNHRTDRAAMNAVRGLNRLNEAPVRNVYEQTFQANIVFATDQPELEQFTEELRLSEIERLAQASTESDVISFGA